MTINSHRWKGNPQEKIFYDMWMSINHKQYDEYATLDYILSGRANEPEHCTDRDKMVAATAIQWLGSPVGMAFLKTCGFERSEF